MKIKRLFKAVSAVMLAICMAVALPGAVKASTPGQAQDVKEVKYGVVSRADQKLIRNLFDAEFYATENPDVKGVVGTNPDKLWNHFIKHGIFEARQCNIDFNVSAYRSSYADLERAFGDDIVAYYRHYMQHGINELRDGKTVEGALRSGKTVFAFWSGDVVARPSVAPAPVVKEEEEYTPPKPAPTPEEKAAAEKAAREAAEAARKAAEEEAERKAAEAEAARKRAEDEAAKKAKEEEDARLAEADRLAREEEARKKAEEEAQTEKAPEAKDGYRVEKQQIAVKASVVVYGNKNGAWTAVDNYELDIEHDDEGRVLSERYRDTGRYYRKYEYDASGNLIKELWNINNNVNGYDGYEYTYNAEGYPASRKTWNQGVLTEWLEYAYNTTTGSSGNRILNIAISKVDFDSNTYEKKDVKFYGYAARYYNDYDALSQESFSDDTRDDYIFNKLGLVTNKIHYAGDSYIYDVVYSYNDMGTQLLVETTRLPAGSGSTKVSQTKTYTYADKYVQVPLAGH